LREKEKKSDKKEIKESLLVKVSEVKRALLANNHFTCFIVKNSI